MFRSIQDNYTLQWMHGHLQIIGLLWCGLYILNTKVTCWRSSLTLSKLLRYIICLHSHGNWWPAWRPLWARAPSVSYAYPLQSAFVWHAWGKIFPHAGLLEPFGSPSMQTWACFSLSIINTDIFLSLTPVSQWPRHFRRYSCNLGSKKRSVLDFSY